MPSRAPLVLGFDTSSAHCGTALLSGQDCLAAQYVDMAKGQAERLMGMIDETLEEAGKSYSDLDAVAVGVGPGNFTGIRISVSAARGLALALGIPAVGVSLLEALAYGSSGPVLTCIDGKRDRYYVRGSAWGPQFEPALKTIPEIRDLIADRTETPVLIGQNSHELAKLIGLKAGPAAYAPASAIARIGVERVASGEPIQRPAPLYLRAADAAPSKIAAPVILP